MRGGTSGDAGMASAPVARHSNPMTMDKQIPVDPSARADAKDDDGLHEVLPDLAYQRQIFVNVIFQGVPGQGRTWVLIDAGLHGSTAAIVKAAGKRFGAKRPPAAIIMTHGHFDHVGALESLANEWQVPVYAHRSELPNLDGTSAYPKPDPSVGGGMMATLSPLYPRGPINVSRWLRALPEDGSVPGMSGWQWIHTPGHTTGHVSLWRPSDRTLIAGDAFVTTNAEAAYTAAITQKPELHGPPRYFTPDWEGARLSVMRLAALDPEVVITGHGPAMRGPEMREALHALADNFERVAVPEHGMYVDGLPPESGEGRPSESR
jgi:glyoxylase-like metal-dependent hydrolase (beta-lactamase superfamily II)